jgi:hypothetical protein
MPDVDVRRLTRGGALSVAPLLGLWIAAGLALSAITGRVTDWFVMTDELLYERLAIAAARLGTVVSHIHGQATSNLDQLYPLTLAPLYRHGLVTNDLHQADILNAWLMSSACIPAFLLGRRVTGSRTAAYVLAALSVCVPWIFYASFLLTEVVAYPAFLWALLSMQAAVSRPGLRNDLLAIAGIGLAFFARTQFAVLVVVFPLVVLVHSARGRAVRATLARHRLLTGVYLAGGVAAVGLAAVGRLHTLLGGYGASLTGAIPHGTGRSLLEHVSTLSLGVGLVPAIAGLAWIAATVVAPSRDRESDVFALIAFVTLVGVIVEVTIFDLRLGAGPIVYDRYLFYLAPVVLIGFAGALLCARPPGVALVGAGALLAAGFAVNVPPLFEWQQFVTLSPDAPVSVLYRPLVGFVGSLGWARFSLAALVIALTAVYALAARFVPRRAFALVAAAVVVVVIPTESTYVFQRLFAVPGWSERPLTAPSAASQRLTWVDRSAGTDADVTVVPYQVSSAYLVSLRYWRDIEFWNASADRSAYVADPHSYGYTGNNFPRLPIRVDERTGTIGTKPTPYAVQSVTESRFRIAGRVQEQTQEAMLIRAVVPWRAAWITLGPYEDGWLKPDGAARVRIFATGRERSPRVYRLTLQLAAPDGVTSRPFTVVSGAAHVAGAVSAGSATIVNSLPVCVPARGYADVAVQATGNSVIPGDLALPDALQAPRVGSLLVADISVSDDVGRRCTVSGS